MKKYVFKSSIKKIAKGYLWFLQYGEETYAGVAGTQKAALEAIFSLLKSIK